MTIYIDTDYKCHTEDGAELRQIETDAFNGKCRNYIEGYRFVPSGETWTREDGERFHGEMIAPFVDSAILEAYQKVYEEMQEIQGDMKNALDELGVDEE